MHRPRASFAARERISRFKLIRRRKTYDFRFPVTQTLSGACKIDNRLHNCWQTRNLKSTIRNWMNQPVLLHIVEKLEALFGKLPEKIQKPILHELTPLKELFLQQRPPRFLILGSIDKPAPELVRIFFGLPQTEQTANAPSSIFRWQEINAGGHGRLSILDARGAVDSSRKQIEEELKRHPADVILFVDEAVEKRRA